MPRYRLLDPVMSEKWRRQTSTTSRPHSRRHIHNRCKLALFACISGCLSGCLAAFTPPHYSIRYLTHLTLRCMHLQRAMSTPEAHCRPVWSRAGRAARTSSMESGLAVLGRYFADTSRAIVVADTYCASRLARHLTHFGAFASDFPFEQGSVVVLYPGQNSDTR
ncbi:hypothetical protein GE09DRAFT_475621 [Coniochaeta sp. 2T2.1]|nr:hypothetical protein GE09DRAFT_475621 [Coniochaeta sp. 2T2.1]